MAVPADELLEATRNFERALERLRHSTKESEDARADLKSAQATLQALLDKTEKE